ncbi:MAG: histidine kinase dimerization/phosphoacceptor domain -containing protein [Limisphaerales bacterium]
MKTKQVPPKPSPAEVPPRPAAAIPLAARVLHLAWLPIPVLLAAILLFRAAGLGGSYEPHTLRLVLSFTFYTLVSLGTLFLIGRSFLASGRPGLLLLECGVVLWSLAGTVADAVDHGDANINVSIFNTSIFLAALCHLTGAALALRPQRPLRAKPLWLAAGCALALGALALVTRAALGGRMPVFFVPGQGGTPMRYFVLISAIAMFVLSAALLRAGQRAARPPFTSWYALALLLMAVGLFGIMIQLSLGSVVNWLARSAEWLSGVYLLMAALAALRESRLPLLPSAETSRRESYRYAMAVVLVLAATAVRMAFLQGIGMRHVFVTFYPAVMLAALYGGGRAGLLATALSALSADYFWIGPVGTLVVKDSADGAALAVFCVSGAVVSIIVEAMHRAQKRSAAAEAGAKAAVEQALAAEALRESEEKYRTLFENMAEEVHFWQVLRDAGGRITTWRLVDANPPTLRTWGRKNIDEIRGKTTDEIFGPGAKEHYMPVVQKIMTEGVPFSFEDYFPNLDRHFRFTSVPLGDHFITTGADITGIKRAERELFASNQRLEALMRALPVGVSFSDDTTCQRITGNPAVVAQFEVTTQDNLSASAPDANAPGRQVRFFHSGQPITDTDLPLQRAVAENRFIAPMDLEVELPSGRRWFAEASGAPIHDAEGKVIGGVAVTVDITERKRAEEALRTTMQRFYSVLSSMYGSILLVTNEGRAEFANQSFCDLFDLKVSPKGLIGLDQSEMLDRVRLAYAHPEEQVARIREIVSRGQPVKGERVAMCDDRTCLRDFIPIDLEGRPYGRLWHHIDITELSRIEEALHQSKDKLALALRSAGMGVWRLDLREPKRHFDDQVCRCLGLDPARFAGTAEEFYAAVHPGDHDHLKDALARTIATGAPYEVEYRAVWQDESVRHIASRGQLARDPAGQPERIDGLVWDITKPKRAEERIQASLREKEVLLKEIHHRVKNNLQVISSLVDLQADVLGDAALRGVFADLRDRVRSMALVHEKLYQSESLARVDFAEYARSLLSYLWRAHAGSEAGIRLKLNLQPVSLSVETAVPCGLILNELAANAIKHAFRGRSDGEVTVTLHASPEGRVRLCVSDNGAGLPSGLDWRQSPSMGLGLVRMLAGQLNGTLEAGLGGGTRFEIAFAQTETR